MQCRLIDLSISLDGKQRLTVELDGDFRKTWDNLHDKDCDFTVKRYRKKRSLDANAYAWVLIGKIAEKKRISPREVYRNAILDIGGVYDVVSVRKDAVERLKRQWCSQGIGWQVEEIYCSVIGWTNLMLYYGSSVFDTKQMADMIESLRQDALSIGIEVDDENKIKTLLEEFENAESYRNARQVDERA